jgi:hypothetical protein
MATAPRRADAVRLLEHDGGYSHPVQFGGGRQARGAGADHDDARRAVHQRDPLRLDASLGRLAAARPEGCSPGWPWA